MGGPSFSSFLPCSTRYCKGGEGQEKGRKRSDGWKGRERKGSIRNLERNRWKKIKINGEVKEKKKSKGLFFFSLFSLFLPFTLPSLHSSFPSLFLPLTLLSPHSAFPSPPLGPETQESCQACEVLGTHFCPFFPSLFPFFFHCYKCVFLQCPFFLCIAVVTYLFVLFVCFLLFFYLCFFFFFLVYLHVFRYGFVIIFIIWYCYCFFILFLF